MSEFLTREKATTADVMQSIDWPQQCKMENRMPSQPASGGLGVWFTEREEEASSMKKEKNIARREVFANIMIALGCLLIIGSLGLAAYNIWDAKRAEEASNEIAERIAKEIGDRFADSLTVLPYTDPNTPMPTVTIDGYEYIGILEIPSESLTLPVMSKWDYTRLKISPCLFTGSYYSDDMVICGHNFARHFSPIKWIALGTDVYFKNVEGLSYHYVVSNLETIEPSAVEDMITADDWDLTLFTCTTGGASRCAVRCTRVEDSGV